MILTEKEAATKACVRSGGQGWAPGPIPDADTLPVWRCVGSRCMAWRLEDDGKRIAPARTSIRKDDGTLEYTTPDKPPTDPGWEAIKNDGGMVTGFVRSLTPRGVCGLAHKP